MKNLEENTQSSPAPMSMAALLAYFLKLGTFGFGGPIALAGRMERDLVSLKKWITHEEYIEGLAFSQLAPGPLAAQLAIYLGWIRKGFLGASLVGIAFILPSFAMVLLISKLYIQFGGGTGIQALFYGIGAAVIAIIIQSIHKLMKRTVGSDPLLWVIFFVNLVVTAWMKSEIVWLFVASGLLVVMFRMWKEKSLKVPTLTITPLAFLLPRQSEGADQNILKIFIFFAKAGTFVFGSGLAIIPFLHGGVVKDFHWLNERQFLDAIAIAMITPGPVVISVAFIGYLVAGPVGAIVAAIGVFAPVYFTVILFAPYFHRFGKKPGVKSFVAGLTSAAIGSIAGAAIILGHQAILDWPTLLIGITSLALLYSKRKVPEPLIIMAAGMVGIALKIR